MLAVGVATAAGWVDWPALGQWLRPHVGLVVVFGMGGALLATAVTRAVQGAWRRRSAPRTLSWWVVTAAGVVVAGVAWGATTWLLREADQAKDPAAARVEAIKTGLAIGAGTGGVFALLLAVRRQWHQELSAVGAEHDASERRVTELYTKAVEQLGSDKAAVRMGGLYALERVAQNTPDQRQTVVNVLCAYLRLPFTPPSTSPRRLGIRRPHRPRHTRSGVITIRSPVASTTSSSTGDDELEVRLAAQRILAKHLHPGPTPTTPTDTFWENIDLNLVGATLVNLNLDGCSVHSATFYRARFTRGATFNGARFTDIARFGGARFTGIARFNETRFGGYAWFAGARFTGYTRFAGARFTGDARFTGAQFTDGVSFAGARFTGYAWFTRAQFTGPAGFAETQFGKGTPPEIVALQQNTPADDVPDDSTEPIA